MTEEVIIKGKLSTNYVDEGHAIWLELDGKELHEIIDKHGLLNKNVELTIRERKMEEK